MYKIGLLMDTVLDGNGGVQQVMKSWGRFLIELGYDVRFIVPDSPDQGEFEGRILSLGSKFESFLSPTSIPLSFWVSEAEIDERVLAGDFDLIHAGVPANPFFGGKILKKATCPVVVTYMSYMRNELNRFALSLLEQCTGLRNFIDICIAPSKPAQQESEFVYKKECEIIPFGVDRPSKRSKIKTKFDSDDAELYAELGIKKDEESFTILFLGRLEKRKGVEYLLRSFVKVSKQYEDVRLIIAGSGPRKNMLEKLAGNFDIEVSFLGYFKEDVKVYLYELADLCVFPALYGESFGVVLVEAMLTGTVPIVFENEGYNWVMRDLPYLVVEKGNVSKLAARILTMIQEPALLQNFSKDVVDYSKRYTWSKVGKKLLTVYNKLIS
jgi:phosphatidylinositol alpha-mannosyltransferase